MTTITAKQQDLFRTRLSQERARIKGDLDSLDAEVARLGMDQQTEGGGAAWAQALAAAEAQKEREQRIADQLRHGNEIKDLLREQTQATQNVMSAQLDRMEAIAQRAMDSAADRNRDAGASAVVGRSLDAMSVGSTSIPIAIGLICRRRWAVLASAILGFGGSITGIGIAGVYSIFGMSGLEVRLGPILLIEPSVVALWSLILLFVLAIGLPMAGPYLMKKEIGHFA